MNIKKLFAMMSVSAIPVMASAAMPADIQDSDHKTAAGTDKVNEVIGAAGIFTLSAGPVPVTERTREGERKFMMLEEEYARKLGWFVDNSEVCKQAMRSLSKTWDCTGGDGGCREDTDKSF